MLSFKQYIAQYPNGHKEKSKDQQVAKAIKKRISEARNQEAIENEIVKKCEFIKFLIDDPSEELLLVIRKDTITIAFIDPNQE